ncbi:MAG: type VII secretion protein EssC, partial [Candidatus Saccharibacteria bacterium]
MNRSYLFQRAPRLNAQFEKREVEIVTPPSPPTFPGTSMITTILPLIGTVLGFGFMYYYYATMSINGAGSAWLFLGGSAAMMLTSYLASFITYSQQKRRYIRDKYRRLDRYRAYLAEVKEELSALDRQQRELMLQVDDSPLSCLSKAANLDASLWERSPKDDDYLCVRLGLGERFSEVSIKEPRIDSIIDPDPLILEAQAVSKSYRFVSDAPVCLNLREKGAIGLVGERQSVLNMARNLAVQLAAHHSPDEVKMIAAFPEIEKNLWTWMRWLPHVWNDNRHRRFLAYKKSDAHELFKEFNDILNKRSLRRVLEGTDKVRELPDFIFFLDGDLVEKEAILTRLLSDGSGIGAYTFILAEKREQLPKECQAIIETNYGLGRILATDLLAPISFKPDETSIYLADEFARTMAPVRLHQVFSPTEIPGSISLFELLDITNPKDLDINQIWNSTEVYNSLAVPIGLRGGGEPLMLNIHESEHGPHGLIAGATGAGKSELLQTLVSLLALHYHPHYLGFILVDYKGGGMANTLVDLPHVIGTITNLQGNLANRALTALKGELLRRQQVLAGLSIGHIDEYQKLYQKGTVNDPLPHLVFLVDEFAELKAEQPEFMQELISAVRVGRSLGVHLLLATQKPAGVVDEQVWGNTRFRICLRVERPEDSREVLKRPDAASINQAGRAYMQVGSNELFELFQVAWSGAEYDPSGFISEDPHEILEVGLDGTRHSFKDPMLNLTAERAACSQLEALIGCIRDSAIQMKLDKLPGPWLPPLTKTIYLEEVMDAERRSWNGEEWGQSAKGLEAVLGLVDDPGEREQRPLIVNLSREGHVALYGVPGSGKTTFLQTMITSLATA